MHEFKKGISLGEEWWSGRKLLPSPVTSVNEALLSTPEGLWVWRRLGNGSYAWTTLNTPS